MFPSKVPLSVERSRSGSLDTRELSQIPKRHIDRFSRFSTVHPWARQTDAHIDREPWVICNNRSHPCPACRQCGLITPASTVSFLFEEVNKCPKWFGKRQHRRRVTPRGGECICSSRALDKHIRPWLVRYNVPVHVHHQKFFSSHHQRQYSTETSNLNNYVDRIRASAADHHYVTHGCTCHSTPIASWTSRRTHLNRFLLVLHRQLIGDVQRFNFMDIWSACSHPVRNLAITKVRSSVIMVALNNCTGYCILKGLQWVKYY